MSSIPIPETTWAYIAGMIDGEGSLLLSRHYKRPFTRAGKPNTMSKRGYEIEPHLSISSMNKRNVEIMQEMIHLGKFVTVVYRREGIATNEGYELRFCPNMLRVLLPKVIPHLVQKKERAELILKLLLYREGKRKQSAEREKFYLDLEQEFRQIVMKEKPYLLKTVVSRTGKLSQRNKNFVESYQTNTYVPGRDKCLAMEILANQTGEEKK